jgi:hypothetical protein
MGTTALADEYRYLLLWPLSKYMCGLGRDRGGDYAHAHYVASIPVSQTLAHPKSPCSAATLGVMCH